MSPFFFFNDTATTEIYTLSLHDALPIYRKDNSQGTGRRQGAGQEPAAALSGTAAPMDGLEPSASRSEEHTSELQSRPHLVCRLLLEKKKTKYILLGISTHRLISRELSRR